MIKRVLVILIVAFHAVFAQCARVNHLVTNFTAGEISKVLYGRSDVAQYHNSAETILNGVVMPYGGVLKRPGTYFVAETKTSSKKSRLVPFQFNIEQAYIIEFGDKYFRFYTDEGQIADPDNASIAYEISTDYDEADLFDISYAQDADTMYLCHPDYEPMKLTRSGHTDWTLTPMLSLNIATPAKLISGGGWDTGTFLVDYIVDGVITTIASKRTNEEVWAGQDFGVGVEKAIRNLRVYRYSGLSSKVTFQYSDNESSWTTTNIDAEPITTGTWNDLSVDDYGRHRYWRIYSPASEAYFAFHEMEMLEGAQDWVMPSLSENTTQVTIASSTTAIDTVSTLTASSSLFESTMVGTQFFLHDGWVLITDVASGISATATVKDALSAGTATTEWSEGAWSEKRGYPASVTFYEQRLFFAYTDTQPQTVWGSKINDFDYFKTDIADDDAVNFTIVDNQVNAINWLLSAKSINIGTSGGIFMLSSGSSDEPLTPTNLIVKKQNQYGASSKTPFKIGSFVYYLQRNNKKIRELAFNYEYEAYLAKDVTVLAPHITGNGIAEMDYQQSPHNLLWCVRSDGEIALLTRQFEHSVTGWTRIVTDGNYESVAVIPYGSEDQVWVIVNRTIEGSTVRYVEYFKPFDYGDDSEDCFFVDCGLTYDNDSVAVTSVSGLDHLENESCTIYTGGLTSDSDTVSSGTVTWDTEANTVQVGLPFTFTLKTVPVEAGATIGTAHGINKRISKIGVRMHESGIYQVGETGAYLTVTPTSALYTGYILSYPRIKDAKDAQVTITQTNPYSMHVCAIVFEMETFDQ